MSVLLENISKRYSSVREDICALDHINLKIEQGEWISVLGPSGSGKTTLLNCIAGIVQPDYGDIYNNGQNISKLSPKELQEYRRATIGYVFQDFRLLEQYSVLDNVILPQIPYQPIKVIKDRAISLLSELGLEERLTHLPSQLSGGEKQRTAIARALINNPSLLICDEPTGNLDKDSRDQIMKILGQLHKSGHTILLVTHDKEIANQGDREFYLKDGNLSETKV